MHPSSTASWKREWVEIETSVVGVDSDLPRGSARKSVGKRAAMALLVQESGFHLSQISLKPLKINLDPILFQSFDTGYESVLHSSKEVSPEVVRRKYLPSLCWNADICSDILSFFVSSNRVGAFEVVLLHVAVNSNGQYEPQNISAVRQSREPPKKLSQFSDRSQDC